MIWQLKSQTDKRKVYINSQTGSECVLDLIYTDKMQNNWYSFQDYFAMPYIRTAYAKTITNLFQVGISAEDLRGWITKEKELLKSNDKEKYEKLYSLILEKESIIENTVDPLKQHLALCTLYILSDDERIDFWSPDTAKNKLDLWALDIDLQAFFLSEHTKRIQHYYQDYKNISQIASNIMDKSTIAQ